MENSNFAMEVANLLLAAGMLTRHPDANPSSRWICCHKGVTHLSGNEKEAWLFCLLSTNSQYHLPDQSPHVSICYVMQLAAPVSGVSAFKSHCHSVSPSSHPMVVHLSGPHAFQVVDATEI